MKAIPAEIGGIPISVEVVTAPGDEATSRIPRQDRAKELFERAEAVIEQMAESTSRIAKRVSSREARPEQIEIQFGIKFSSQAGIVFASAATEASLAVKIVYGGSAASESEEPLVEPKIGGSEE